MQTRYNYVIDVWIRQAEKDRRLQVHNSLALIYLSDNQPTLDLSKLYNRLQKFFRKPNQGQRTTLKKKRRQTSYFAPVSKWNSFLCLNFWGTIFRYFFTVKKRQRFVTRRWTFQTSLIGFSTIEGFSHLNFPEHILNISNYVLRFTGVLLFAQLEWNENCCGFLWWQPTN